LRRIRTIPVLLIHKGGLYKSIQFKNHQYVGDPINAVKIFNEKGADELAIIDIDASRNGKAPDIDKIADIASEAFMPLSYGGGITTFQQAKDLFYNGIEKLIVNKSALINASLITAVADSFGSQAIVASIDVKKNFWGKYKVYADNGSKDTGLDPIDFAKQCEKAGAGEILLNSIDRDGTYKGYDIEILSKVAANVSVPVIACGGAGSVDDFKKAVHEGQASAVAAGSFFVFKRPHNAVLITYPASLAKL
jgi:cyclase